MSEFYQSTPVTTLFESEGILLGGGRKQDPDSLHLTIDEVILYLDYDFIESTVKMQIFDDSLRTYTFDEVYSQESYDRAVSDIQKISEEYPNRVEFRRIMETWKLFFTVAPKIVVIEGLVSDFTAKCDTCSDYNVDEFNFIYAPAFPGTELSESSLGLHWEYGCFGGKIYEGTFEDNVEEVHSMLRKMLIKAESKYKGEIKRALETIDGVATSSDQEIGL